jgi:hypothetical protein
MMKHSRILKLHFIAKNISNIKKTDKTLKRINLATKLQPFFQSSSLTGTVKTGTIGSLKFKKI